VDKEEEECEHFKVILNLLFHSSLREEMLKGFRKSLEFHKLHKSQESVQSRKPREFDILGVLAIAVCITVLSRKVKNQSQWNTGNKVQQKPMLQVIDHDSLSISDKFRLFILISKVEVHHHIKHEEDIN
jgi:hypothetical protein